MKKILVSLLAVMCIAVLITVLPVSAAETSGSCGESLTWTLEDGVLTISGSGKMTDYTHDGGAPWLGSRAEITKIVIQDGVTSIGNKAFAELDNVVEVTIPDSVKSLGVQAFVHCTQLKSVKIPE